MTIDSKKFKDDLSKRFIKLLNSERGTATKLAESIGKDPGFINNVKRERPVNALHLKAVELVFGPSKVLEMLKEPLDINDVEFKSKDALKGNQQNPINSFKDPDKGLQNNERLIGIEMASEELYEKVSDYLKATHEAVKIMQKRERK